MNFFKQKKCYNTYKAYLVNFLKINLWSHIFYAYLIVFLEHICVYFFRAPSH